MVTIVDPIAWYCFLCGEFTLEAYFVHFEDGDDSVLLCGDCALWCSQGAIESNGQVKECSDG